jgi:hypothetical protein
VIGYASNTGTRRNLQALMQYKWRVLLTPSHPRPPANGLRFAIDNGAWTAYQQQKPFDDKAFGNLVERYGCAADFVVLPDIVAGGRDSLTFSVSWLPHLSTLKHLLLPLQDGMSHHEVGIVLRQNPKVGLFLGGSTEYKLQEMYAWGAVAHAWKRWYHIGRVNTAKRIRLCAEAGADSFDGTSATMYSSTLPLLNAATQFQSLLSPARMMGVEDTL